MTTDAERLADWLEADACDLQTPRQAAALLRSQAAEIERANALLRQAYAVIEEAVELIGSDECTARETLAAIKQHLEEV